jgi:hypothetical protein
MSKIVNVCESAPFVCSAALRQPEFLKIAAFSQLITGTSIPKGADEIGYVFNALIARNQKGSTRTRVTQYPIIKTASADRLLYKQGLDAHAGTEVTVWSLSPSDAAISHAMTALANFVYGGES